ncbi:MAG TPA: hypothetical protein VFB04_08065 [Terriglobales bacterium]|nr:hypothetical protein [Terriglobales bacterium]
MKTRLTGVCQFLALALVAACGLATFAVAEDTMPAHPRFVVIPPKPALPGHENPTGTLQEWNGSFTSNGTNYPFVMVGADPSTNQGALITTWIIPVKLILSDGSVWDPLAGGAFSPLGRTILSPIFDSTTTYTQGGVNVGTTQYIDAFQRANFWSTVQNNPNSHLLLGGPTSHITVLPELVLNVPAADGHQGSEFGITVALVDINYLDNQFNNYIAQNNIINPTGFPIFETANTYLTEGGCCIGGYHSATGAQTYAHFTYITTPGVFSQDVSALSHEVGEWADDPLYPRQNSTPCGILEDGDPLENGQPGHPFGTWAYQLHNFTYHLQDLVTLRYFGGDPNGPVNMFWTFQGYTGITRICQNGS